MPKDSDSGAIFEGQIKTFSEIFCVSLQDPRTVALVENVGRGGGGITRI